MKKIISLLITFVLVLGLGAFAAQAQEEAIPADVQGYAQNAVNGVKDFMKRPDVGFMDRYFKTAEEVDALTLGEAMPLYSFDRTVDSMGAYSASAVNAWVFLLNGADGAKAYFTVRREAEGDLSWSGPNAAVNLAPALDIMNKLSQKAGVNEAPMLFEVYGEMAVGQSFNGDERIIPVPGTATELDPSFAKVSRYDELPTYAEGAAALKNNSVPMSGTDALSLPAGSNALTELKATLHSSSDTWKVAALCAAGAVVIAGIAVVLMKRKRTA